jgi:NAD(P)-dependent dehydrogenase (short-subunit alcohol dehydrogenase family)
VSGITVVTGAASGIGRQISARLLADASLVVAVDGDADALAAAAESSSNMIPLAGDLSALDTHERAAAAAEAAGELRSWVNCCQRDAPCRGSVASIYGTSVAVRRLRRRGGGVVVNVSASGKSASFPRGYRDAAAQEAVVRATRSIAMDYGRFGIRAHVVSAASAPLDRGWRRQEVAETVVRLLTESSAALSPSLRLEEARCA